MTKYIKIRLYEKIEVMKEKDESLCKDFTILNQNIAMDDREFTYFLDLLKDWFKTHGIELEIKGY